MNDIALNSNKELSDLEIKKLYKGIYVKSDILTERVLFLMFGFGILLAFFYDTWLIALGVGGICLLSYFIAKKLLPESVLYQYVMSATSAIFAAQYIYQMHGMAEMHFWVFISSTILILYQNWRLQIPLIVIVVIHHGSFAYLQYIGYKEIYFTQLSYMDLTAFFFHGVLASCVCFIAGVWSYNIHQRTIHDAWSLKTLTTLQAELQKSVDHANDLNKDLQNKNEELRASEEELSASGEELKQINENLNSLVENRSKVIIDQNKKLVHHAFVSAHQVRSPLARILGIVNLIKHDVELTEKGKELYEHLKLSAQELDDILREVRVSLNESDYIETEKEDSNSQPN